MGKSLAELSSELEALDAEEAALGARLEAELADMGELRERLARMRACRAELDGARGRAEELGARVTATAAKAQRMSLQVRELDRAQSRVQATLSVVTAASQLAKSAAVVAAAMDEERFEEAATHIHSVLDRLGDDGAGVASVAAAAPDGSSGVGGRRGSEEDDGRERDSALLAQILAARDALRARALAESAAQPAGNGASPSAGGSEASVLRFVRILPLVGEPAEAFRRLAAFRRASLRAAIAAARTLAEGAARGDESKVAWAELVARALQGTAAAIEADAPFVRARLGGARALARYVVEMHDECRSLGAGLAGALVRSRQLQARIAALREAEAGSGAGAGGGAGCGGAGGCAGSCGSCCCSGGVEAGGGADGERAKALAEVDGAADELCHLLNGGGSYDCYVLQRLDDAADEERRAAAAGADADADADARDDGSVPTLVLLCSQPPPFEPSGAAGTGAANGGGGGGGIGFSLASAYAAEAISASLSHAMRRALSMEVAGARDAAATGGARVGGISGSACVGAGVRGVSCGGSSAPLASSAPDDAFYLVKRAIQRAAHTQSLWVLARVTRAAAQLLRSPYLDTLRSRAKGGGGGPGLALLAAALGGGGGGGAGGSGAGGGQRLGAIGSKLSAAYGATATFVSAGAGVGGSAEPAEPLPFLANLNNLATSLEYLERLEAQQEESCAAICALFQMPSAPHVATAFSAAAAAGAAAAGALGPPSERANGGGEPEPTSGAAGAAGARATSAARALLGRALAEAHAARAELGSLRPPFKAAHAQAVSQLSTSVAQRLKSRLDLVAGASYDVADGGDAAGDGGGAGGGGGGSAESFVPALSEALDAQLAMLKGALLETNYEAVLAGVTRFVAERIEAIVLQKRFTLRGAFQLDRDVRALVAFLSSASSTTARSAFARLSQIVTLLSLERESEVLDIWTPPQPSGAADGGVASGDAGPRWKLSASEVRQVLCLRVDFRRETVAHLKL